MIFKKGSPTPTNWYFLNQLILAIAIYNSCVIWKSSQKQEELQKLHDIISEQERQLEELRSEQQEKSNNEMQISRRPSSGGSSTADSSGEDGYEESTPPTG